MLLLSYLTLAISAALAETPATPPAPAAPAPAPAAPAPAVDVRTVVLPAFPPPASPSLPGSEPFCTTLDGLLVRAREPEPFASLRTVAARDLPAFSGAQAVCSPVSPPGPSASCMLATSNGGAFGDPAVFQADQQRLQIWTPQLGALVQACLGGSWTVTIDPEPPPLDTNFTSVNQQAITWRDAAGVQVQLVSGTYFLAGDTPYGGRSLMLTVIGAPGH